MNLIQLQEHLKDMPMRAIMEYANGRNPQVPPYLALGELNRRKQMEQSSKTGQPPQGTVKERLEKELTGQAADLMQAGAAKQAQSNQQLQQSLMGQPQPVPEGTPQPPQPEEEMPQMARGGLTALPVGDMFKFASGGGVVAFGDGDIVVDPMMGTTAPQNDATAEDLTLMERLGIFNPENRRAIERGEREAAARKNPPKEEKKAEQPSGTPYDPATATRRVDFPPQAAIPPRPSTGIPAALGMPKTPTFTQPDADAYDKKLAEFKKANPGLVGSEFQSLLDKIGQQDEADRARMAAQEKGRTRADFWKALIDAGEASRGQKGIGSVFGGFGKSYGASQAEADERANAQARMRREQDLGMAKMRAELENARRAEARGDFEASFKHKQEAEKIGRDLTQTEFANKMEVAKLAEQARGHNIQADHKGPQLIQMAHEIQRNNPNMQFNEALERAGLAQQGAQYQGVEARKLQAIEAAFQKEAPYDPKMIQYMAKDPADAARMRKENEATLNSIRARFGVSAQGQQTDPNAPTPGFGQARPK